MKIRTRKIVTSHFNTRSKNISMHPGELMEILSREDETKFEIICSKTGRMFERSSKDIKTSYNRCKIINGDGEFLDILLSKVKSEDQITAKYTVIKFKF